MYLKDIEILNFRNIDRMNLNFDKNINIFIGKNAQGKTSILESIYVLAFTKSCRSASDDEILKKTKYFFRIRGNFKVGNLTRKMEIYYKKDQKTVKINNKKVSRMSDYISKLNIIMFSPDDLDIIKKAPSCRRNFINVELCQLHNEYLVALNEYNKLLKMRNDYIRKNYSNINYNYLDVITDSLIDRLLIIYKYRQDFFMKINNYVDDVFYKLTKFRNFRIVYKKSVDLVNKKDLINFYKENYDNDIEKGSTNYGPHKDDFYFYLNEDDLKLYGSQGLQRLGILSVKFSEIYLFKEVKNYYPIVLLDDIFSEIDLDKRKNILKFIKSNIQFIITTTDIDDISDKIINKASVYNIENGCIKKGVK